MKKYSKEIFRHQVTRGYGLRCNEFPTEEEVLDELIEFSKTKQDIRIYRHLVRKEWVKNKKYKPTDVDGVEIPRGDEIWYLDIYYQKK